VFLFVATLFAPAAHAQSACEKMVTDGLKKQDAALVASYRSLLGCDKAVAERVFVDYMKATGDVQTLIDLSLSAISADAYAAVWPMLDKVPYAVRDQVASGIGAACVDEPKLLPFLQGAYFSLKGVDFDNWKPALVACQAAPMSAWLEETIRKVPEKTYDDKYTAVMAAYSKRQQAAALPLLTEAATTAGKGTGPFQQLVDTMESSVRPDGYGEPSAEDKSALESALMSVAATATPEHAMIVAEKLYNLELPQSAASLLVRVYPDKVQANGSLMYGVAAIESCDGEAQVHFAEVIEPGKRWTVLQDLEAPARAWKPKLKCSAAEPWPVIPTAAPIGSASELTAFVDDLVKQWTEKGLEVKTREEKAITLP
jgi:hypothetical protein